MGPQGEVIYISVALSQTSTMVRDPGYEATALHGVPNNATAFTSTPYCGYL